MDINFEIGYLKTSPKPCRLSNRAGRIVVLRCDTDVPVPSDVIVLEVSKDMWILKGQKARAVWQCITVIDEVFYYHPDNP